MGLEGVDDEILQDFLVEAGEIIETLSEQLVELEKRPTDRELLNAIFRGFHTVKGGAGFLSLSELVKACHGAENVFDTLRNGGRQVDSELMDVILQSHDVISAMFAQVQNHEDPDPAPEDLLSKLKELSQPQGAAPQPVAPPPPPPPPPKVEEPKPAVQATASKHDDIDNITDDEFEALLDSLHGKGVAPGAQGNDQPKQICPDPTDSDFEAMLMKVTSDPNNQVQSPKPAVSAPAPAQAAPVATQPASPSASASAGDTMTDDEFESLLDSLHGKGGIPGQASVPSAPVASAPEVKPQVAQSTPTAPTEPPKASPKVAPKPQAAQPAKASATADTTVRVETKILDTIMNMVGELVLVRNRLVSLGSTQKNEELKKVISNLDVVTADLQGAVMKTRMQQIKKVFGRFPRVVRDVARNLNKKIELVMIGEETDLDKNLVDALADPMVHLVRNSCDHGIEMPEDRVKAGKPETGTITLSASQQGDHILLRIIDDGAGMDPERLKQVAINKGILDESAAARMTDTEAFNLIFAPGFSTKEQISDISGRGVGMDVVKTNITKLNGSLHIDSERGVGTTIEIKVPLTLAILPTLMVEVGGHSFALPLTSVSEIFYLELNSVRNVDGQATIVIRDKAIPLFFLQDWLIRDLPADYEHPKCGHVVLVNFGGSQQVAFVVDELIGQEEVVIKPLDNLLHGTPGMAGATVTSNGGIALILDVPSLLKAYAKKYSSTIKKLR
jgi:two-component system chemotaxis sensor kinase CheA